MGKKRSKKDKPTRQRYNSMMGKERRKKKHENKLEFDAERKKLRLELIEQACSKLKKTVPELRKLIGTPNIKRLNSVINGTYITEEWFVSRETKKENVHESTKITKTKNKKLSMPERKRETKKISKRSNQRNDET